MLVFFIDSKQNRVIEYFQTPFVGSERNTLEKEVKGICIR